MWDSAIGCQCDQKEVSKAKSLFGFILYKYTVFTCSNAIT